MPKPSPKKTKKPKKAKLEFAPDAWERFESLVKSAAKMGPRPHDQNRPQIKKRVKPTTKAKPRLK